MLTLFFTGLLLTYGVEFAFLRDTFGAHEHGLQFYYQAWVLMAIGSAYALHYVGVCGGRGLRLKRVAVTTVFVLGWAGLSGLCHPCQGQRLSGRGHLDGTAFVARYRPDEAAVIAWLRANAPPNAVIVEAPVAPIPITTPSRPTPVGPPCWGGRS